MVHISPLWAATFLLVGRLDAFVAGEEEELEAGDDMCAAMANAPCSPLNMACGEPSCSAALECVPSTRRCASIPRRYGEPCSGECAEGLRCSVACGICVDASEDDMASIAFGAAVTEYALTTATACGMSSQKTFRTWAGTVRTEHPLLMPKNDDQLRSILSRARAGGCAVRPAGSGHSAAGVVAEVTGSVVVISLTEYTPSDLEWVVPTLLEDEEASVRIPAGSTQLDLYSTIRPRGYFLPTQTAGWLFSVGGLLSNFVHGGTFGAGPVYSSVRSLRVMLWDGTVTVIDDEGGLRYWRNGYGLLGVITAAELSVVQRPHFWFGTLPAQPLKDGWNRESFQSYIDGVKADYSAGEFFLNPHSREILAIVQRDRLPDPGSFSLSDGECTWNFWEWQCVPHELCSYRYQFGDWKIDHSCRATAKPTPSNDDECTWDYLSLSCRNADQCSYQFQLGDTILKDSCRLTVPPPPDTPTMVESYRKLLLANPLLGLNGVPVGDDRLQQNMYCLASRVGLEPLMLGLAMREIPRLVRDAYETTNDGFFIGESLPLPSPLLCYLVPADRLFDVLDAVSSLDFILTAPLDWRYVTFDDDVAVLQPGGLRSGEWAAVEATSLEIPGWTPDEWRQQFYDIEQIFKEVGGVPHPGKYFGMGSDELGIIRPFQSVRSDDLYGEAQKEDFRAYATSVDPGGLFQSGFMADYISLRK